VTLISALKKFLQILGTALHVPEDLEYSFPWDSEIS
jgi:hypothetical protein